MKVLQKDSVPSRNFRDAIELFVANSASSGEISLTGYLAEHCLLDRGASVGSIGWLPRIEALTLNSIVSPEATFVVLGCGTLAGQRSYPLDLIGEIQAHGFQLRAQFADLTIPGRWPQILSAIASSRIGILGISARWASTEPGFWATLEQFAEREKLIIYIRNLLDSRSPQASLSLIRSMPPKWDQNLIATTPSSTWFAYDAERAAEIRETLRLSGVFPLTAAESDSDRADLPVVVRNERSLELVDGAGHFPRVVYLTNIESQSQIDYKSGWSKPESDGCWTGNDESVMQIRLPSSMPTTPTAIKVSGNAWVPPDKSEQTVEISVGDEPESWVETVFTDSQDIKSIVVPCKDVQCDSTGAVIRFRVRDPGRPSEHGGTDTRLLGFKCRSISVFA